MNKRIHMTKAEGLTWNATKGHTVGKDSLPLQHPTGNTSAAAMVWYRVVSPSMSRYHSTQDRLLWMSHSRELHGYLHHHELEKAVMVETAAGDRKDREQTGQMQKEAAA